MAKQSISIGSSANDGTGDPLRTAFDKINDNFTELYDVTGAGTSNNVQISTNSIISTNVDGNIILDPNGTGKVVLATATELRFTDHVDNAIPYVDADGDIQFSAAMTYSGTTVQLESVTIKDNEIGTADSNSNLKINPAGTGTVHFVIPEQSTVGSAGAAAAVPASPTTYFEIRVNGTRYVVPAFAVS